MLVTHDNPPPIEDAGLDFTPYDTRLDTARGGIEDGPGINRFVPIVHHECFTPKRRLNSSQRKELAIKQAALRLAAGLEDRDLRTLGKEIGCCHTAIDNALRRLCERIGMHKFLASTNARANMAAARRAKIA